MNRYTNLPIIALTLSAAYLTANPSNPAVLSGEAIFSSEGTSLCIQASHDTHIEWSDFSIGVGEKTLFIQPSKNAVAINRVAGFNPSAILGTLESNGRVYLINPNGLLVGKEAIVDTAAFLASTLEMGPDLVFKGDSKASIVNLGTIQAQEGDAILIAHTVKNHGHIAAPVGSALLGAGEEIWIQPSSRERIFIRAQSASQDGIGIENTGSIESVRSELKADGNLYSFAIRHTGAIDALGIREENGDIYLISENGLVQSFGSLHAPKGDIEVLGREVQMHDGSRVDASSPSGGGKIWIGGSLQGKNPGTFHADRTFVGQDVQLVADAQEMGDGGEVVVWSDRHTVFYGQISAQGGIDSGNGGIAEVSGGQLSYFGTVSTVAPKGKIGLLLLDPGDVTIDSFAGVSSPVFPTGMMGMTDLYDPPIAPGDLDHMNLVTALGTNDVIVSTTAGAFGTGAISVLAPVGWLSGTKLTLIGDSSITIWSDVFSSALALPDSQVVLDLQAPTIVIGDHTMVASSLNVGGLSGGVNMSGPSSLSVYGGSAAMARANLRAGSFSLTGGAFTLESGSSDGAGALVFATNSFTGTFTGDVTITGGGDGAGIGGQQSMMAPPTAISISTLGNMTMLGGSGAGAMANCGALLNLFSAGGSIDCNIAGSLFIQGGSAVFDGKSGFFSFAPATISVVARDITLIGGNATSMDGNSVLFANFSGDMTATTTGPNGLLMMGGTTDTCEVIMAAFGTMTVNTARLQMIGGSSTVASVVLGAGSQLDLNVAGDVDITSPSIAGGASALIANFGPPIVMDIDVGGNLNIQSYSDFCGIRAQGMGPHTLNLSAANLQISSFSDTAALIGVDDGTANINISGNCSILGSSTPPAMGAGFAGIYGASTAGFIGNLNVSVSNLFITGGSANLCRAGIVVGDIFTGTGGGGGTINLTANGSTGIRLDAGSGIDSAAMIEIFGSDPSNSITFTAPHPSANLIMNGSTSEARIATQLGGPIVDPIGGSIILNGLATIVVGPGPVSQLLLIAGQNIELQSAASSIQNLSGGELTLVVDNNFPNPPLLGSGRFLSVANATVFTTDGITDGLLRIFSSRQSQNAILGTLNGQLFTAGTIFTNTALEQWAAYYPNSLGGIPYTIFYKESERLLAQQAAIIADQLLTGFHPFNEFPGWLEEFWFEYKAGMDPSFYSTYEAMDAEPFYFRRRYISLINQPKTYTLLVQ